MEPLTLKQKPGQPGTGCFGCLAPSRQNRPRSRATPGNISTGCLAFKQANSIRSVMKPQKKMDSGDYTCTVQCEGHIYRSWVTFLPAQARIIMILWAIRL